MNQVKFLGQASILLVNDIGASAQYYIDKCGFQHPAHYGKPVEFCMLFHGQCVLMLNQVKNPQDIVPHWKVVQGLWNVYYWVDDVKRFYEEMKNRGAIINYGLALKPYGCLEFGIRDLDDYDIGFGQIVNTETTQE